MLFDNYDTWEKTDNDGIAAHNLVVLMCDRKPDQKKFPIEFAQWDKEMNEIRKWCISIHERRIDLNIRDLEKWRENRVK